jgi:hypothetical protein
LLLPAWQWPLIRPVRAITATLPFNGTLPVGTLRYLYGGQVLASVPLTLLPGP